jgi:signal transduction histidine kinase
MVRHFLTLYLGIVATLLAASWGQERLWEIYGQREENRARAAALEVVEAQLLAVPSGDRPTLVADLATRSRLDLELFDAADIAGEETLALLERGEPAFMQESSGQTWMLKRLQDDGRVLAFRYSTPQTQRSLLEWALALLFYAAIALVIMIWLWPLTRDLRRLENATQGYGNRNWTFDPQIRSGSPIYSLATAFRRMAERIDGLIGSHKEMSNAVAHEIKTPLARMRFEIEMARAAATPQKMAEHLDHINSDITELNGFVKAALDYAILERAEMALNVTEHDFTQMLPAVTEAVRRSAPVDLEIDCQVAAQATRVACDAHLMETVLRNLLYNAMRYARKRIRVSFQVDPSSATGAERAHGHAQAVTYSLRVDDDGPGIPETDRQRVFGTFVQLGEPGGNKTGYGLGLAIVKRVIEWHGGTAAVTQSPLGGASFSVQWSPALN